MPIRPRASSSLPSSAVLVATVLAAVALAVFVAPGVARADAPVPAPAPTPAPGPAPATPVVPTLALSQAVVGGTASACTRSGDAACLRTTLAALGLRIVAGPAASEAGRSVALAFVHRVPGTRGMVAAGTAGATLAADGTATVAVASTPIARGPGTWCVVGSLPAVAGQPATPGSPATPAVPATPTSPGSPAQPAVAPQPAVAAQAAVTATRTCLRWRPPIELGWVGDTALGSHAYGNPPANGSHEFDAVAKLLQAPDLLIGNYEGTLSTGGHPRCTGGAKCYIFQAPPSRARALKAAGFDVLNFANNHSLDMGLGARAQSARAMRAAGLGVSGLPGQVTVRQVADTRVAIVGISKYPGTSSMRSADVRALVAAAKRQADVVVVTMHAGLEGVGGVHVPRGDDDNAPTYTATHVAIDAGADVVFGSGPHVVRGVERYRGRFIVYSSGNFAGWHNFGIGGLTSQSGVIDMTFDPFGAPLAARWNGVHLVGPGLPVPDRSVVRHVAALSRADFGSRGARFARDGSFH